MSLEDYVNSGPQRFQSPNSLNEWIPKDFPDDNFFLDGSFDPPLNLTGKASEAMMLSMTTSMSQEASRPHSGTAANPVRAYKSYLLDRPYFRPVAVQLMRRGYSGALEMPLMVVRVPHQKATWSRSTKDRYAESSAS